MSRVNSRRVLNPSSTLFSFLSLSLLDVDVDVDVFRFWKMETRDHPSAGDSAFSTSAAQLQVQKPTTPAVTSNIARLDVRASSLLWTVIFGQGARQ